MDTDQDVLPVVGAEVAKDEGKVLRAVNVGLVAVCAPLTVGIRDDRLRDAGDQAFRATAVLDELLDGDQREVVLVGELPQRGQAHHRPVVADHLANHAGRRQPGEHRQVDGGLGVAAPAQDAALGVPEREHVAGADQVIGDARGTGEKLDGLRAVGSGDTRGDVVPCVHADGERGAVVLLVLARHLRHVQPVEVRAEHRDADQASSVADREGEQVGGGLRRREDDVPFVLPVGVVDHDDRTAPSDVLDRSGNLVERDGGVALGFRVAGGTGRRGPPGRCLHDQLILRR